MSPQITLHTPLQLPPAEIPNYLNQLWSNDESGNKGANTFCLLVWQPAWMEQKLVKSKKVDGPILGNHRLDLVEAARKIVLEEDLPHSTPPLDKSVHASVPLSNSPENIKDLRGQHIDSAISDLKPRRLITLAPTIDNGDELEALVAAYCPLLEEGGGNNACGDVVVFRGGMATINEGLGIIEDLMPKDLPSWLWWNGSIDEAKELLSQLSTPNRRIIIDTALGDPILCLQLLNEKIQTGQAVNDLNWLRLRSWRETLAMVFDPIQRRNELNNVVKLDIDVEGNNPVQGLLLTGWIASRLNWKLQKCESKDEGIMEAIFTRADEKIVKFRLTALPIGNPSIHPGALVGLRLISEPESSDKKAICVILASESGECMRLEAGGMASMDLIEEVVPIQNSSVEEDVARLLASSRGSTSPLLEATTPIATELLRLSNWIE